MSQNFKLRSSIHPSLKKKKLLQGTLLAIVGLAFLLYGALTLNANALSFWGLPIFCVGVFFISRGLIPYRKMNKMEIHPDEMVISEDGQKLCYIAHNKSIMTVPIQSIDKVTFIKASLNDYGLGITLKQPIPEKILVHDAKFSMSDFIAKSRQRYNSDLFFPYFSERSTETLKEFL